MSKNPSKLTRRTYLRGALACAVAPWMPGLARAGQPGVRIVAGGDAMFGRHNNGVLREVGGDEPFAHIRPLFGAADVGAINLETPICGASSRGAGSLHFRAPIARAAQLRAAGIDVVCTANNHSEDMGLPAVAETLAHLDAARVLGVGTAAAGDDPWRAAPMQRNGHGLLWLGFTMRRNLGLPRKGQAIPVAFCWDDRAPDEIPPRIQALRRAHPRSLICVQVHWGEEYATAPGRGQRALAAAMVSAGANLVLGHHPHVLQPVAVHPGAAVAFSLGNLVFDQARAATRRSALLDVRFVPGADGAWTVSGARLHPLQLIDRHQGPRPSTPAEAAAFLPALGQASSHLGQAWRADGHTVVSGSPP